MTPVDALFAWLSERPRPVGVQTEPAASGWGRNATMCYRHEAGGLFFGVTLRTEKGSIHDGFARTRDRAILLALHAAKTGKRKCEE